MKTLVVGIHGFKGAGKDTVATMMQSYTAEGESYSIAYADQLKKGLSTLLNVPLEWFYNEQLKETVYPPYGITPRQMMTSVNDWALPMFGPEVFTAKVRSQFSNRAKGVRLFLVTDVRFDGRETDWIRDEGGFILHVHNPRKQASDHSSEQGIPFKEGDILLENDKGLMELEAKAGKLMADICEKYWGGNW